MGAADGFEIDARGTRGDGGEPEKDERGGLDLTGTFFKAWQGLLWLLGDRKEEEEEATAAAAAAAKRETVAKK